MCLSDFEPPDLSCKCYIDCLYCDCILANRIEVAGKRAISTCGFAYSKLINLLF